MKKIFFCCNQNKEAIVNKSPVSSTTRSTTRSPNRIHSTASTPASKRKITVVSFGNNNNHNDAKPRSISTVRLEKVISEINEYHRRTELELKKSVKTQARELLWFFSIFVVYVMFGAFIFFYIEECSDASMPSDSSIPPLQDVTEMPSYENISLTCEKLYTSFISRLYANENKTFLNNSKHFLEECESIVQDAPLPVTITPGYRRDCSVNALQLLKYAEFTIFTLLTIGYGNTVPITIVGRMTLMVYAVIGIPLAVTMYSVAGKLLVQLITLLVRMFQTRILRLQSEVTHIQTKTLFASVFFMLTIMLTGCAVTTSSKMENLDFSSSIYFWFVSLTTIGYGDIHFKRERHLKSPHLLMLSAGNLLFGLGIVAAIIEAFSMALEKKDLQMSTIVIDNGNEENEENEEEESALHLLHRNDQYEEREYTELTDIVNKPDVNETNNILKSCGNINKGHTDDNNHLYFTERSISVVSFENGHIKWEDLSDAENN